MPNAKTTELKSFSDRVDDFIGFFSPRIAAKRKYYRFVAHHMFNAYRGAERSRLRDPWRPGGGSADRDLLSDLGALRERSRDLIRNDGIASGAVDTIITNVIGSGIKPQSRIDRDALKIDEEYADQLQKKIEEIWERWVPAADAGNRMNFYEIEELSERSRMINGESIIIPLRIPPDRYKRADRHYSLALQIVEPDRLMTPTSLRGDKSIRSGVKLGEYGEPLSYYITVNHPGDMYASFLRSNEYIEYPAYTNIGDPNIFHLYHVKRPGQTRGEPFFAPVLNLFKDRFEYMEDELVAARVAACFAVFIKKNNAYDTQIGRIDPDDPSNKKQRSEVISPGIIEYLKPGEEIQSFNPNRPGGTFGLFMERILRDISSGLNIPYEILAKDFSKSNYSNTRAALLEARRFFMMQQRFIADKLAQPILILLLEEAYLKGELPILDFYANREAYVRTRWIAPGWQWVDPLNEVQAARDGIAANISTLAEETATQGQDWEDVLEQRARELKKTKELEKKYDVNMTQAYKSTNKGRPVEPGITDDSPAEQDDDLIGAGEYDPNNPQGKES